MSRFRTGKRRQMRTQMVLPVRLWVIAASGNHKSFLAHTLDISDHGVKLGGVQGALKVGELIEVQYHQQRTKFRVLWIKTLDKPWEKQVGAECTEPEKNPWGVELPTGMDEYEEKD